MYEYFDRLLRERGVKVSDVAKATGIASSTFTDWKKGRYQPKADKLEKIAAFFQVPVWYLQNGQVAHQLDSATVNSDMLAFESYIRNIGWEIIRKPESDECILSSSDISISITSEQFEQFEFRIRNECINGLLGYVAQALNKKYRNSAKIISGFERPVDDPDYLMASAAHATENPDAGDGDTPEADMDKI